MLQILLVVKLSEKVTIPTKTQPGAEASLLQSARSRASSSEVIRGHLDWFRIFQPEHS